MLKRSVIVAVVLLAASVWIRTVALASTAYDGVWSVSIITDKGTCDRGYRYALHITNGVVSYDDPSFNVSGQVNARGDVKVMIGFGQSVASGTGRLSRDYGQGVWSGRSPSSQCSGHWEAERRSAKLSP
jgi:hypothetical protein